MSKKVYKQMKDQEDVFESNTLRLVPFEKKYTDNKNEQEDSKSNGWNIVKKIKNKKTNLKIRQKIKDSKTLEKFAKIPCRNYPGCKWKKDCWYLHKE